MDWAKLTADLERLRTSPRTMPSIYSTVEDLERTLAEKQQNLAQAQAELSTLAEVLAINLQASLAFNDEDAAIETMRALIAQKSFVRAVVMDDAGTRFAEYVNPNVIRSPERGAIDALIAEDLIVPGITVCGVALSRAAGFYVVRPVSSKDRIALTGTVEIVLATIPVKGVAHFRSKGRLVASSAGEDGHGSPPNNTGLITDDENPAMDRRVSSREPDTQ